MSVPIITRRATGELTALTTGELACPSSVPNTHAEIMKQPRAPASIRYSGQ
jgi:hypothetical protein